jgi:selenium-binding protein 1
MHNPDSSHGFCGAALSANVIHFWKSKEGKWEWEKIIDVENEPHPDWPIPVPGVMSAILYQWMINIFILTIGYMEI